MMNRCRILLPLLAAVGWLTVPPASAADSASGHFKLGEHLFEPTDVYAAHMPDWMMPANTVVMVLLADFPLDHAKLAKASRVERGAELHREAAAQALAHKKNIVQLFVRPNGDCDLFAYFSAAILEVRLDEEEPNEACQWKSAKAPRVEGRYWTKAPVRYNAAQSYSFDFKVAVDVAAR